MAIGSMTERSEFMVELRKTPPAVPVLLLVIHVITSDEGAIDTAHSRPPVSLLFGQQ